MPAFKGFPADTLSFLDELADNNTREWFNDNKQRYEDLVREPALDFIATMGPELARLSDHFVAMPKKVGGSLMRVYRDTRFGKDKTPYKTNIGIQFRHELGKDAHAPGYYLHIATDGCFVGVGMWHPEPVALAAIRQRIADHPDKWRKVARAKSFAGHFELSGESLKRPPRGFAADDPNIDDLKRKDFIGIASFEPSAIAVPGFIKEVAGQFRRGSAYMKFLCDAVGVDF